MTNALYTNAIRDHITVIVDHFVRSLCDKAVVPDEVYDKLVQVVSIEFRDASLYFKAVAENDGYIYRISGAYNVETDCLACLRFGLYDSE